MPVMGDAKVTHPTSFERSRPGRRASSMPRLDVPEVDPADALPGVELATQAPALPELGELDVVRHFTACRTATTGSTSASTRWGRAR